MFRAEDRITPDVLSDPKLQDEFSRLETDEDRRDFLDALEALEEAETEDLVSWELLKSELGL